MGIGFAGWRMFTPFQEWLALLMIMHRAELVHVTQRF